MNQNKNYKFIDLFAGAGGLSEGFIRAGFEPIAHIEMDHYACDTLKTRAAYHYLKANNKLSIYEQYLRTKKEKTVRSIASAIKGFNGRLWPSK